VATVRDEGPGFRLDEVRPDRGRHVGLGLLRERARLAGGSLEVTTGPGQGTELALRLPLSPRLALGGQITAGTRVPPVLPGADRTISVG
jgi:signal transduction histidine kinase